VVIDPRKFLHVLLELEFTHGFRFPETKEEDMPDILHRVGINAKPEKVFKALTTLEGLRHWWTLETTGNAKRGA
jgi:hypothetical protein